MCLNLYRKSALLVCLAGAMMLSAPVHLLAQEELECESGSESCAEMETTGAAERVAPLAGPEQVENRLHFDSNQVTPLFPSDFARGYFDWKDRIKEENGVGFGGDYSFAYL